MKRLGFDDWVRDFWRYRVGAPIGWRDRIAAVAVLGIIWFAVGALGWAILVLAFLAGE